MSSPLAVERHVAPSKALVGVPKPGPYGRRAATLAARIAMHIETLVPRGRARCLDIGCGDMAVAEAVQELAPRTVWSCIDVRPVPPDAQGEARWSKYAQFDGKKVPYPDDQFDVAVLCDVLHHTPQNAAILLAEARRVARRVIVKDHFEQGAYSRSILRLIDFVGHWSHGLAAREGDFTRDGFVRLAVERGLVIESIDCGLELHDHLPVGRSTWRHGSSFIAVLHRH